MNDRDKPYIDANGTIVIPFNVNKKFVRGCCLRQIFRTLE